VTQRPAVSQPIQPRRADLGRPGRPAAIGGAGIAGGRWDANRSINRDIDIDRDWDVDWDYDRWGCCYHPLARAATYGAVAAATYDYYDDDWDDDGDVVYVLPDTTCYTEVINGVTYERCGDKYYQPQFSGTNTTYTVTSSP
jgi:hypothetical protein